MTGRRAKEIRRQALREDPDRRQNKVPELKRVYYALRSQTHPTPTPVIWVDPPRSKDPESKKPKRSNSRSKPPEPDPATFFGPVGPAPETRPEQPYFASRSHVRNAPSIMSAMGRRLITEDWKRHAIVRRAKATEKAAIVKYPSLKALRRGVR